MSEFAALYGGRLWSIMSWDQLSAFWARLPPSGWYLYAVGEAPPMEPADPEQTAAFVRRVDALLRENHRHDYCGIVYADNIEQPTLVKIYDPDNLGVSCGASTQSPLPGWVMSRVPPDDLNAGRPPPENRRRWWRALTGR